MMGMSIKTCDEKGFYKRLPYEFRPGSGPLEAVEHICWFGQPLHASAFPAWSLTKLCKREDYNHKVFTFGFLGKIQGHLLVC
jgi:hypothetical protein